IAIIHSIFNVLCTLLMLPLDHMLEKLVCRLVPDSKEKEKQNELDERLLATPFLALAQSRTVAIKMAECATSALKKSLVSLVSYSPAVADEIRDAESKCDEYEDILGTFLIRVSSSSLSQEENEEATTLLKVIGDYERISDHAVNILESAEELRDKKIFLTEDALREYDVMVQAVNEVLTLSEKAFVQSDIETAVNVEPLEQVIDGLKEQLRTSHILRMQKGECTVEAGFVWSDLLTNLERVSDHCSNIAGCVMDQQQHNLNQHENLNTYRKSSKAFECKYRFYQEKYAVEQ
ncbi:MAG: PhoU domain-containing protein, partial [Eubacteriales bacterium]|nr:PhoU domain-containing protein [Eubacteriales bacterium]